MPDLTPIERAKQMLAVIEPGDDNGFIEHAQDAAKTYALIAIAESLADIQATLRRFEEPLARAAKHPK